MDVNSSVRSVGGEQVIGRKKDRSRKVIAGLSPPPAKK
jgi:hypothetical protein